MGEQKTNELQSFNAKRLEETVLPVKLVDTVPTFDSSDSFDAIVKEMARSIDEMKRIESCYHKDGEFEKILNVNKIKMNSLKELIQLIDLRKKLYGTRSVDLDSLEFKVFGQYIIETVKKTFESFCKANSINADSNFVNQFLTHFSGDLQGWQTEVYKRIENIRAE